MKFIDLVSQYQAHQSKIDERIQAVLQHGQYIMGPEVAECEQQLANLIGVKHAILNSSGTTALQLALMALDIGPGDEIITSSFSFFATAETAKLLGATPVLVDIDPNTFNIDAHLIEAAITPRTKAIIPVSMFGQCADMDAINAIAARHQLPVIEDAAQSLGAKYKDRFSGNLSTIACTSFFPSKPLGAYGDAGACFTNDDALAKRIRSLLDHGQEGRYHHTSIGINGRCDTLQAAVILAKLDFFAEELRQRQVVAEWYYEALNGVIDLPKIADYNKSVYAQFTVQVDDREAFQAALSAVGIPTVVHYPKGLHQQPALSDATVVGSLKHAERACQRVVSLPFYAGMSREDVEKVAGVIQSLMLVDIQ